MPNVTNAGAFIDGTHDSDFLVGTTDFYSASNTYDTASIGTVKAPAAGEYVVVLKASGVSGGSKDNITPSTITLDGTKTEAVDTEVTKSLTLILISRNQTINLSSYEFKGTAKTANAQFTLRKDGTSGVWYGRAYLTCSETSTGKLTTVYSNTVSGTVVS